MKPSTPIHDPSRQGIVMMCLMVLFGIMTLMTVAVFIVAQTDLQVLQQYRRGQTAFFNAEAALQYAKSKIEADLKSGTIELNGDPITVLYNPPADMEFEPIRKLTPLPDPDMYTMSVTGYTQNAQSVIEAAFRQKGLLAGMGIFGNEVARIQPQDNIYSYRSKLGHPPLRSTGEAGIGSNLEISFQPNVILDGTVLLGQDELGNTATGPASTAYPVQEMGERVDPDPLGAVGGELEEATAYYRDPSNNNNGDAVPAIQNNRITGSMYLPPGNYYGSTFSMGPGDVLEIGGTAENPVNIFLEANGGADFRMQPNSSITFSTGTQAPASLRIYSVSENGFRLQPNLDFQGLIYAPNAEIRMQPNNNFYGAVWGKEILMQPGGDFWIDISLLNEYKSTTIEYVQWKEARVR